MTRIAIDGLAFDVPDDMTEVDVICRGEDRGGYRDQLRATYRRKSGKIDVPDLAREYERRLQAELGRNLRCTSRNAEGNRHTLGFEIDIAGERVVHDATLSVQDGAVLTVAVSRRVS